MDCMQYVLSAFPNGWGRITGAAREGLKTSQAAAALPTHHPPSPPPQQHCLSMLSVGRQSSPSPSFLSTLQIFETKKSNTSVANSSFHDPAIRGCLVEITVVHYTLLIMIRFLFLRSSLYESCIMNISSSKDLCWGFFTVFKYASSFTNSLRLCLKFPPLRFLSLLQVHSQSFKYCIENSHLLTDSSMKEHVPFHSPGHNSQSWRPQN